MAQTNRAARLEARIAPNILEIVRHAAELQGRSVSDFVVTAAEKSARKTIEQAHLIHLSVEDQVRFAELLIDPPILSPAMERAKSAHKRLIQNADNASVSD
jgi:uncharacterized protein (DUF1778 family)